MKSLITFLLTGFVLFGYAQIQNEIAKEMPVLQNGSTLTGGSIYQLKGARYFHYNVQNHVANVNLLSGEFEILNSKQLKSNDKSKEVYLAIIPINKIDFLIFTAKPNPSNTIIEIWKNSIDTETFQITPMEMVSEMEIEDEDWSANLKCEYRQSPSGKLQMLLFRNNSNIRIAVFTSDGYLKTQLKTTILDGEDLTSPKSCVMDDDANVYIASLTAYHNTNYQYLSDKIIVRCINNESDSHIELSESGYLYSAYGINLSISAQNQIQLIHFTADKSKNNSSNNGVVFYRFNSQHLEELVRIKTDFGPGSAISYNASPFMILSSLEDNQGNPTFIYGAMTGIRGQQKSGPTHWLKIFKVNLAQKKVEMHYLFNETPGELEDIYFTPSLIQKGNACYIFTQLIPEHIRMNLSEDMELTPGKARGYLMKYDGNQLIYQELLLPNIEGLTNTDFGTAMFSTDNHLLIPAMNFTSTFDQGNIVHLHFSVNN